MGILTYLAIGLVLIIFMLLNYYIGYKGSRLINAFRPETKTLIYWVAYWIVALSFMLNRMLSRFLPWAINRVLEVIGAYWLGIMLYLLLLYLPFELINFLAAKAGLWKKLCLNSRTVTKYSGIIIIALVAVIMTVGYINADIPVVKKYDVQIPKKAGNIKSLNVVMISDLHIGSVGHADLIKRAVDKINTLEPDVVLFAGDIIDDDIDTFVKKNYAEEFKRIKSKYGMYAVTGNHEYYGGDSEEFIRRFEEAGVNVLMDEAVKVADSFYLAGRIDKNSKNFSGAKRMGNPVFLKNLDKSLPLILMDHEPDALDEAMTAGVDLELSGHTHKGQIFPGNLITDKVYEDDYGYLKKDNFQIIVSSGLGTWGSPIRLGSRSEIVNARITFGE